MAVLLVSPDSRGRITLGTKVATEAYYAVEVDRNGVITLTPSVVLARSELDELTAIRPALSPEEAFGITGMEDFAEALYVNRESRRRSVPDPVATTVGELHSLIWGDAA